MGTGTPTVVSVLRDRVRRLEITVGIGFFAAGFGGVIAAPLVMLVMPWAEKHRSPWALAMAHASISRLWIYFVLPLLWLGVSRIARDLRPWTTAIGSALVGELLYVGLDAISGTLGAVVAHPSLWLPRLLTLVLGVYLSAKAIATSKPPGRSAAGA